MTSAFLGLTLAALGAPSPAVVIDGEFLDWTGAETEETRPAEGEAPFPRLLASHDRQRLLFLLRLEKPRNLQALSDDTISVLVDADDDTDTGVQAQGVSGIDFSLELSPPRGDSPSAPRFGAAIGVARPDRGLLEYRRPHEAGFHGAPSTATRDFEMAVDRHQLEALLAAPLGPDLRIYLEAGARGAGGEPPAGFLHGLTEPARPEPPSGTGSELFSAPPPGTLRVLSWNVGEQLFIRRSERFRRLIGLVSPDVLMLDEVPRSVTKEQVRALLPGSEGDRWNVLIGRGGGRQRGVLASHLPLRALPGFRILRYRAEALEIVRSQGTRRMLDDLDQDGGNTLPLAAASLRWQDRELWLTVFDLQCCGSDGSPEDRFRIEQVGLIRTTIADAIRRSGAPDALVLAGDLNLVGSRRPLTDLLEPLPEVEPLASSPLRRLSGQSNASYVEPGPFLPGRLDYLIHSTELESEGSTALDLGDLELEHLRALGLPPDATERASDHLPLITDLRWREP